MRRFALILTLLVSGLAFGREPLENERAAYGTAFERVASRVRLWPAFAPGETTCRRTSTSPWPSIPHTFSMTERRGRVRSTATERRIVDWIESMGF